MVGEKLIFGRPLRLNDSGLYECVVQNNLGVGKTEYMLTILGRCIIFWSDLCILGFFWGFMQTFCPLVVSIVALVSFVREI